MRYGFTTGSCAAAAAKAAVFMLLSGERKEEITIQTPKGIPFTAQISDIFMEQGKASCAVKKDGGDDPDITTGAHIVATVHIEKAEEESFRIPKIIIDGGAGVGRVTKPGLDQPVGNAAINRVPRQMVEKEIMEVLRLFDFHGSMSVVISVPGGEELAKSTFNPRLGIQGGISILGTSGIVEPMSNQALLDTIRVECNQKKALGQRILAVSPGNYGLDFMKKTYGYDLDRSVKCSNFIGETIDMAVELGFGKMLLTGHIGKMVKVAGGIMNTHSKEGDCRMELLTACAIRAGANAEVAAEILDAVSTEEGVRILRAAGCAEGALKDLSDRIMYHLNRRGGGRIQIELMVYSMEFGLLAESDGAEGMLRELLKAEPKD